MKNKGIRLKSRLLPPLAPAAPLPAPHNAVLQGHQDSEDDMLEAVDNFDSSSQGPGPYTENEDLSAEEDMLNPALRLDHPVQGVFFQGFGADDPRRHISSPLGGHLQQGEGLWTFGRSIDAPNQEEPQQPYSRGSFPSRSSSEKRLAMRRSPPAAPAQRGRLMPWRKSPHSAGIQPMLESETELSSGHKRSSSKNFSQLYGLGIEQEQDEEQEEECDGDSFLDDDIYEPPESTERQRAGKSLRERFRLPSKSEKSTAREGGIPPAHQPHQTQLLSSPEVSEYHLESTLRSIPSDRFSKGYQQQQSGRGAPPIHLEELSTAHRPPRPPSQTAETPVPDTCKKAAAQGHTDLSTETRAATSVTRAHHGSSQQEEITRAYDGRESGLGGESSMKPRALAMESSQFKLSSGLESQHLQPRYSEIKEEEGDGEGGRRSDDLRISQLERGAMGGAYKGSIFGGKLLESQKDMADSSEKKSESTSLHFMSKLSSLDPASTNRGSHFKQVRFGGVAVESTPPEEASPMPSGTPLTPQRQMMNDELGQSSAGGGGGGGRYDSAGQSGYSMTVECQPSYKLHLREITRKHMENMRPVGLRKKTSAAKVFKERLMSRLNDRIGYIANEFNMERECLQYMQKDLAIHGVKGRVHELETGLVSRVGGGAQTPVLLETPPPPLVSGGVGPDYTYVTKYTF